MATTTETEAYWAAKVAQFEAEAKVAWPNLVEVAKAIGDRAQVQTGAGVALIVNQVGYGKDADLDAIKARTATIETIVATQDGRGVILDWHQGETDFETWVYYERWAEGVRIAHGYVHPATRKIVQTG